jgi:hypothetical protein
VEKMTSANSTTTSNCRALVTTVHTAVGETDRLRRPISPYLTQLLATKHGLPQTRQQQRAKAQDAAAAYETQGAVERHPYRHKMWLQR